MTAAPSGAALPETGTPGSPGLTGSSASPSGTATGTPAGSEAQGATTAAAASQAAALAGLAGQTGVTVRSEAASQGTNSQGTTAQPVDPASAVQAMPQQVASAQSATTGGGQTQTSSQDQSRDPSQDQGDGRNAAGTAVAASAQATPQAAGAAQASPTTDATTATGSVQGQTRGQTAASSGATDPIPATGLVQTQSAAGGDPVAGAQPVRQPMPASPVEQIRLQVSKGLKDGGDTLNIQLHPDDLGRVEIKLSMQDGQVRAAITADRPETLQLLKSDAGQLHQALSSAGLSSDGNSLSFHLRGDQQNQQQAQQQAARGGADHGTGNGGTASDDGDGGDDPGSSLSPVIAGGGSGTRGIDINV